VNAPPVIRYTQGADHVRYIQYTFLPKLWPSGCLLLRAHQKCEPAVLLRGHHRVVERETEFASHHHKVFYCVADGGFCRDCRA
jgi:hypothetical protein